MENANYGDEVDPYGDEEMLLNDDHMMQEGGDDFFYEDKWEKTFVYYWYSFIDSS